MKNKGMKGLVAIIILVTSIGFLSCETDDISTLPSGLDYKQEMRDFVQEISAYAKAINPDFAVIPQNGSELVSTTGDDEGNADVNYIRAIDGIGQESLNYGYDADDEATPNDEKVWLRTFLNMAKDNGQVKIMVTDYCSTPSKMNTSYAENKANNYISFAADHRALDNIPDFPNPIYNENANIISSLQDAQNFLYLINPDNLFDNKQDFVDAIKNTNYDFVIMDLFFNGDEFTANQIEDLKQKANGGKRLLICYMSIGQAEDYRYYWQSNWQVGKPSFIDKEDPNWPGNYFVRYWDREWQHIIFGNDQSYLKKIVDAGFDGVYLDIIDAFEQYEN